MRRLALGVALLGCAPAAVPPAPAPPTSAPAVAPVSACGCATGGGPDFVQVFARINPSVVGIVAGRKRAGRFQAQRTGTGIVWDAQHIVTNDHLIAEAEEIRVRTHDGKVTRARLVGNDGPTDLALLAIKGRLPPANRGRARDLRPGQWVAAVGNPYGMEQSITVGVVSAVGRQNLPPGGPKYGDFVQADLSLNPGNSGGPLVDTEGRVVGLTTAIIGGASGLSFATPIELVETVVERLQSDGRFVRGFAGLFVKAVSWPAASRAGLASPQGARVRGVVAEGPAATAGLAPGDIILRFNGSAVADAGQLPWLIASTRPGSTVALHVAREKSRLDLTMALTEAR